MFDNSLGLYVYILVFIYIQGCAICREPSRFKKLSKSLVLNKLVKDFTENYLDEEGRYNYLKRLREN